MASPASDGVPCYPAAPPVSALLDDHDHQLYYLDPADADAASFFPATDAQERQPPPPSAAGPRKPRKRARASRRAPTTVLTTDASNFRAMVQEFTGFPAPQFAPQHLGPGVLFGAGPPAAAFGGAPFHHQLLRPSPLKLTTATSHGPPPPPSCNTNTSSFAHTLTLFANSSNENPTAAVAPSLSSQLYSRFGPTFGAGAVPSYGEGFAAATEGERAEHGHGLATSLFHDGDDRYHDH